MKDIRDWPSDSKLQACPDMGLYCSFAFIAFGCCKLARDGFFVPPYAVHAPRNFEKFPRVRVQELSTDRCLGGNDESWCWIYRRSHGQAQLVCIYYFTVTRYYFITRKIFQTMIDVQCKTRMKRHETLNIAIITN